MNTGLAELINLNVKMENTVKRLNSFKSGTLQTFGSKSYSLTMSPMKSKEIAGMTPNDGSFDEIKTI